jgi:hypothetical protein
MREMLDIEDKKLWVQGLLIDCPAGKALDTCPARSLRLIPLKKRLDMVKDMDEEQLDQVITHHKACLAERER